MKILYPEGFDSKQMVRNKPLLNAIKHRKDFNSSKGLTVPAQIGNPQGAGPTAATAYTNNAPSVGKAFLVPQKHYYQYVGIDGTVVRNALEGDDDAMFLDTLKQEMDSAMENIGSELARQAYGSKTGARARVHPTTAISTTSLTLANPQDAVFFEVGMRVVASQNEGGSLRDSGDFITITAVNASTGVLTGDANWSNIASIGNGDYLYRQGDQAAAGSSDLVADGLAGWNPVTAPTSGDSFCGVDRSVYPERLAGCRYNGASDPMELVFINAMVAAKTQVGATFKSGDIFLNPYDFARVQASKEGGRWVTQTSAYGIGIDKFQIGTFTFVEDAYCPVGIARMVADGAFVRASCGDQPGFNDADGLEMSLNRQTDTYEASIVHDGNFYSPRPANLLVISLPTG